MTNPRIGTEPRVTISNPGMYTIRGFRTQSDQFNTGMYPLESSRICPFKDLSVLHKMNMCLSVCSVSQMRPQQYYYFQEVRQQWGQWKVTYSLIR